jgi:hypothetical protein
VNHYFKALMPVGLFNLFKIIDTIFPVKDLAPNDKVSKPGLEPQAWASQISSQAYSNRFPVCCLVSETPGTLLCSSGFELILNSADLQLIPCHHINPMIIVFSVQLTLKIITWLHAN